MKLTFLGTGTSIGVPAIGCRCEVCRSTEAKDKRLRTSALLETDGGIRVLIDCGPDFRQQITRPVEGHPEGLFGKLDAVLVTHIHFDHVGGMDDLRPFCLFGDVDVYAQKDVVDGLHQTMPYCFKQHLYPGVPHLNLHTIHAKDDIKITRPIDIIGKMPPSGASLEGNLNTGWTEFKIPAATDELYIRPIEVMHGQLQILGFVFNNKLAYITDMKTISDDTLESLKGIDTLIINALRFDKVHHSHQLVDDAIVIAKKIGAKRTYFIHVTHDIGTHEIANSRLPQGFEFAYDGQTIS